MLVTTDYLRRRGFRRVSPHLWLCARRHGLRPGEHLSAYDWGAGLLVDLSSLHFTREARGERAHVYFREESPGRWVREGHTPRDDLNRMGLEAAALCAQAEAVVSVLLPLCS